MRSCRRCGVEKPLSEFYERRNPKRHSRFSHYCKECERARVREYKAQNPEKVKAKDRAYYERNRERVAAYKREYEKLRRADPVIREQLLAEARERARRQRLERPEHVREIRRRSLQRRLSDPVRHAALLEQRRIEYRLRKERKGGSLQVRDKRADVYGEDPQVRLPAAPFVAWLERKLSSYESIEALARECGVNSRVFRRYTTGEQQRITLDVADRILTNEGSTHLWELWPELYE